MKRNRVDRQSQQLRRKKASRAGSSARSRVAGLTQACSKVNRTSNRQFEMLTIQEMRAGTPVADSVGNPE